MPRTQWIYAARTGGLFRLFTGLFGCESVFTGAVVLKLMQYLPRGLVIQLRLLESRSSDEGGQ